MNLIRKAGLLAGIVNSVRSQYGKTLNEGSAAQDVLHDKAQISSIPESSISPSSWASYQTVPLEEYSSEFLMRADELFRNVQERVPRARCKRKKGSFSFRLKNGSTAAKILIFENHKGKTSGNWAIDRDGVYVLFRTTDDVQNTIGVAPRHHERFTYEYVEDGSLDRIVENLRDAVAD